MRVYSVIHIEGAKSKVYLKPQICGKVWRVKKYVEDRWRRKWQPAHVFLPGKSHGQRNLVGYNPQGCK